MNKDGVFSYIKIAINVSDDDVINILRQAKLGKSCGEDCFSVEHFIYVSNYAKVY